MISRNADTGIARLKLIPINGDKIIYEIGDQDPTNAGDNVQDSNITLGQFDTKELVLTFSCVDTKGIHTQGPSFTWRNEINLKHRVFQNQDDWMVELKAFPKGKIFYTTDGSSSKEHGAVYEEPFIIPEHSRFILAYAKHKGIASAEEKIDIEQYRTKEVKIDGTLPVTWKCSFDNLTTKKAFAFMDQLENYAGKAYGLIFDIVANDDSQNINYCTDSNYSLEGAEFKEKIQQLQSAVNGGQIFLSIEKIKFENGQNLKDWIAEDKVILEPGDINQ